MIVINNNGQHQVYNPSGFGGDQIKIDTAAVRNTVQELRNINNTINNDFKSVETAMNRLDSTWNGPASTAVFSKFNQLKKNLIGSGGARYQVMDQYCRFLAEAVALDYEKVEDTNKKLSEMFK